MVQVLTKIGITLGYMAAAFVLAEMLFIIMAAINASLFGMGPLIFNN